MSSGNRDDLSLLGSPQSEEGMRPGGAFRGLLGRNTPFGAVLRNMDATFRDIGLGGGNDEPSRLAQETVTEEEPQEDRREDGSTIVGGESKNKKGPRVGGVIDGVVWVGGSNVPGLSRKEPADIMAFRPTTFKELYRQNTLLKEGLSDSKKLDLPSGTTKGISVTSWIQEIKWIVEPRGFDTVFRVYRPSEGREVYLLDNWGELTLTEVRKWVETLETHGDRYDQENLKLSAVAIRESIGPDLYARVASLANTGTTGPEYFKMIIDQVSFLSSSMVRKLSNDLANLDLKKIPGEDVAKLAEVVTEKARQIVGSGNPPPDLKHLVSKPFTTGTDQYFKTHALNIHNKIINQEYMKTWEQMLQEHSHTYQDLVQQSNYSPAKGSKDQDESIHAMIGK